MFLKFTTLREGSPPRFSRQFQKLVPVKRSILRTSYKLRSCSKSHLAPTVLYSVDPKSPMLSAGGSLASDCGLSVTVVYFKLIAWRSTHVEVLDVLLSWKRL
jgi:hypothetical protein